MSSSPSDVKYFDRIIEVSACTRTTLTVVDEVTAPPAPLEADEVSGGVFKLKQALAYLGHLDTGLVDDSWCDDSTGEALKAFQTASGLEATGVYDSKSETALDIALNGGVGQEEGLLPAEEECPPEESSPPSPDEEPPLPPDEEPPPEEEPAPSSEPGECVSCDALDKAVQDGTLSKIKRGSKDQTLVKVLQQHLLDFGYNMGSSGDDKNGVDGGYGDTSATMLSAFRHEANLSTKNENADWLVDNDVPGIRRKCKAKFKTSTPNGPPNNLDGLPDAPLPTGTYYWPLKNPRTTKVYSGDFLKKNSDHTYRHIGAGRDKQSSGKYNRVHAGVDLFGKSGDVVVACESGKIVNFYRFYGFTRHDKTTGAVWSVIVQNDSGTVINYGEVNSNSNTTYNWKVGDRLEAGDEFAVLEKMRDDSMLHFETYANGTKSNTSWSVFKSSPPANLRNPTKYLEALAKSTKT